MRSTRSKKQLKLENGTPEVVEEVNLPEDGQQAPLINLPYEIMERIFFYLELPDIFRLSGAFSNANSCAITFFDNKLAREFSVRAAPQKASKVMYIALSREFERLALFMLMEECNLPVTNSQIRFSKMDEMMTGMNDAIRKKLQADRIPVIRLFLLDIYQKLIHPANTKAIRELVDTNSDDEHENHEYMQRLDMARRMIKMLSHCGAQHTMHLIFTKLPPGLHQAMLNRFGAGLCREAIALGHYNIVVYLLEHGLNVNAYARESQDYRDDELLLLACSVQTVYALAREMNVKYKVTETAGGFAGFFHDRLEIAAKVISLLLQKGANPDNTRSIYVNEIASAFLEKQSTRLFSKEVAEEINKLDFLPVALKTDALKVLEMVINAPQHEQINAPVESPTKKVRRGDADDDDNNNPDTLAVRVSRLFFN